MPKVDPFRNVKAPDRVGRVDISEKEKTFKLHSGCFHAVGQGLFHSGKVTCWDSRSPVHYVYDCGGRSERLMREHVERFADTLGEDARLSLLCISHMHRDHVNGLRWLLDRMRGRIDKVLLPYLYPSERLLLYRSERAGGRPTAPGGTWYLEFLRQPRKFLREEKRVGEVIFVRGGSEATHVRERGEPDLPGPYSAHLEERPEDARFEPDAAFDADERRRHARLRDLELRCGGDVLAEGEPVRYASRRAFISTRQWFFYPFNIEPPQDRMSKFIEAFEGLAHGRHLVDLFMDDAFRSDLRLAYEGIFGKRKLNSSSMAILAGTNANASRFSFAARRPPGTEDAREERAFATEGAAGGAAVRGFLSTGDLPVNEVWESFVHHYQLVPKGGHVDVLLYQVPHHGSRHNWHSSQGSLWASPIFVVSAGFRSRHPHATVLRDMVANNNEVRFVNERYELGHLLECSL